MTKKIRLSQGLYALIDAEDFEYLSQWKWTASLESRGTKFYAIRWSRKSEHGANKSKKVRMHHAVLKMVSSDLPIGHIVDHINHDSLDNRKSNLQIITQAENMRLSLGWKKKGEPWL